MKAELNIQDPDRWQRVAVVGRRQETVRRSPTLTATSYSV